MPTASLAHHVTQHVLGGTLGAQRVALQGLPHQLPGAGRAGGQDALVVGARAHTVPEHLQDPGGRELRGQLGGVIAGAQAWAGGVQVAVLVAQGPGQNLVPE